MKAGVVKGQLGEEVPLTLGGATVLTGGEEVAGAVPVAVATLLSLTATTVRDGATLRATRPRLVLVRGGVRAFVAVAPASALPRAGVMIAAAHAIAAVAAAVLPTRGHSVAPAVGPLLGGGLRSARRFRAPGATDVAGPQTVDLIDLVFTRPRAFRGRKRNALLRSRAGVVVTLGA